MSWDDFVADAVDQGLSGVETLSGIPGTVGASPIQNIGAYGTEVNSSIKSVQLVDGTTGKSRILTNEELKFSYRFSILKNLTSRFIIENVTFRLKRDKNSKITNYPQVAESSLASNVETTTLEPSDSNEMCEEPRTAAFFSA